MPSLASLPAASRWDHRFSVVRPWTPSWRKPLPPSPSCSSRFSPIGSGTSLFSASARADRIIPSSPFMAVGSSIQSAASGSSRRIRLATLSRVPRSSAIFRLFLQYHLVSSPGVHHFPAPLGDRAAGAGPIGDHLDDRHDRHGDRLGLHQAVVVVDQNPELPVVVVPVLVQQPRHVEAVADDDLAGRERQPAVDPLGQPCTTGRRPPRWPGGRRYPTTRSPGRRTCRGRG
jgi:hypothetical protein